MHVSESESRAKGKRDQIKGRENLEKEEFLEGRGEPYCVFETRRRMEKD
jgi:hypothetical protein